MNPSKPSLNIEEEARRILADKAISREWNRDEMTDEQFEAWYPTERAEK